jgi:hypothetical protein
VRTLSAGRNRVRDAQHWALTLSNGAEAMQAIARRKKFLVMVRTERMRVPRKQINNLWPHRAYAGSEV